MGTSNTPAYLVNMDEWKGKIRATAQKWNQDLFVICEENRETPYTIRRERATWANSSAKHSYTVTLDGQWIGSAKRTLNQALRSYDHYRQVLNALRAGHLTQHKAQELGHYDEYSTLPHHPYQYGMHTE